MDVISGPFRYFAGFRGKDHHPEDERKGSLPKLHVHDLMESGRCGD
jgi:hypothetical protein